MTVRCLSTLLLSLSSHLNLTIVDVPSTQGLWNAYPIEPSAPSLDDSLNSRPGLLTTDSINIEEVAHTRCTRRLTYSGCMHSRLPLIAGVESCSTKAMLGATMDGRRSPLQEEGRIGLHH